MEKQLRIIFMGTPDFAVPALRGLINGPHDAVAVYTQPPRPKGRGHKLTSSPVHDLAVRHDIRVFTPEKLKKNADAIAEFQSLNADVAVVAAYGLILPKDILEAPLYGCLNIHASLLPRWRGAAPIQYALWKGDTETGVTIMQMEEGLDTGPMIRKQAIPITSQSTAQSLHDALAEIGAGLTNDVLGDLMRDGALKAETQDDSLSNYASMLTKEDGRIDWTHNADTIDRQVRALNPWPGTFFEKDGMVFKVRSVELTDQTGSEIPGKLLDKSGHIQCGDGSVLKIVTIHPPNARPMDVPSALNGKYLTL